MTTECPNCGMGNAYHDGVNFVCPDCDYEWDDDSISYDDDDDDDEERNEEFY